MVYCANRDKFCYICGQFTVSRNKRNCSETFVVLIRSYFEMEWIDEEYTQDEEYTYMYHTSDVRHVIKCSLIGQWKKIRGQNIIFQ